MVPLRGLGSFHPEGLPAQAAPREGPAPLRYHRRVARGSRESRTGVTMSTPPRLDLTRAQILAFRRTVGALDARLAPGAASLRRAAWAGLQDSMPRAALLSLHARVTGTRPDTWEDPALIQVWGPRFSAYVVAADDRAVFTLGRLPNDATGRRFAQETADQLEDFLAGRRMSYAEAGQALGRN